MMKNVCVYCGSRIPNDSRLSQIAIDLGEALAEHQWGLVYGGGKVGMMGEVADACLSKDGTVIGIIPTALKIREVAHLGITQLIETEDMHSRKAKMEELSDAFVVLPGGFGTLDEFFEILTWRQLGFHNKPIFLVNIHGYFDGLNEFTNSAIQQNFVVKENGGLFTVIDTFEELLEALTTKLAN